LFLPIGKALLDALLKGHRRHETMAHMTTCPCGWTIISPQGANDVKMHISLHLKEYHPGVVQTEAELLAKIKPI
jgi:hypothetical protein